jgi:gag-polypeptide of LTR copia-type
MCKHLNAMTELFNKLADINDPVPEDQKVTTIFSSVEPEYAALTTAIMAWSDDCLTMQEVKYRLIEEWEKKKEIAAITAKEEIFAAYRKFDFSQEAGKRRHISDI